MNNTKIILVPQGNVSRDHSKAWDLSQGNFLAFLADAPSHAEQRTGEYIEDYINRNIESFKNVSGSLDSDELSIKVADFTTGISDELLRLGKGNAYATLALILVFNEYLYVITVGDAAAYIFGKSAIRISEITRLEGRSLLDHNIPEEPIRYKEYSYIGNEQKCFAPKDVWRLPTENVKLVALVSDGAETQFGARNLLDILSREESLDDKERFIRRQLSAGAVKDDVTFLLSEVKLERSKRLSILLRNRLKKSIEEQGENKKDVDERLKRLSQQSSEIETELKEKVSKKGLQDDIKALESYLEKTEKRFNDKVDEIISKNKEEKTTTPKKAKLIKFIDETLQPKLAVMREEISALRSGLKYSGSDKLSLQQEMIDPINQERTTLKRFIEEAIVRETSSKFFDRKEIEGLLEALLKKWGIKAGEGKKKAEDFAEPGRKKTDEKVEDTEALENKDSVSFYTGQGFKLKIKKLFSGLGTFLKGFPRKIFQLKTLFVLSIFVIISLVIYFKWFKDEPIKRSLEQQKQEVVNAGTAQPSTTGTETGGEGEVRRTAAEEKKDEQVIEANYNIYLAFFSPGMREFNGTHKVEDNFICKTYEEFMREVSSERITKNIALPVDVARKNWNDLMKSQVRIYVLPSRLSGLSLSSGFISRKFLLTPPQFKRLQGDEFKGIGGAYKYKPNTDNDRFYYSTLFFRIEIKEGFKLDDFLKKYGAVLTKDWVKEFNKGIKNLDNIKAGEFLNVPFSLELLREDRRDK